MDLHNLDLGSPRFLEFHLCLILEDSFSPKLLESRAWKLLTQWPVLNTRMNLTRTSFKRLEANDRNGFWKATRLLESLNEKFPSLKEVTSRGVAESIGSDKILLSKDTFHDKMFPRAFKIRAVLMNDAHLLQFTVQHPLCDANGLIDIVKAYCALLFGHGIHSLDLNLPLELRTEESNQLEINQPGQAPFALRHERFFRHGWLALVTGVLRQHMYRWRGPVRLEKTCFISKAVIEKLSRAAEAAQVHVTEHDLLMALIYEAIVLRSEKDQESLSPPQFSFVMNISRLLRYSVSLHNPWLIVPVPTYKLPQTLKAPMNTHIASHIRSCIKDARRRLVVGQIIEQHKDVKNRPLRPVHWGSRGPNVVVSSWNHLPLFDLEFPSNLDGKVNKPKYTQCSVQVCPMLDMIGLTFDDGILTWRNHEGFWLHGKLDEKLWDRLSELQASYLRELK